jgi:putative flippase GtrA
MSAARGGLARRAELGQALRFVAAGASNTAAMYAIYLGLLWLGVPYRAAVVGDYAIGIVCGYLLHRRWTFRHRGSSPRSFVRYCVSYVLVFCANVLLLVSFVELWCWDAAWAQVPAIAIATLLSYGVQRSWVFRRRCNGA